MVHRADTRETARTELIDGWDRARQAEPGKSRIILSHTNSDVQALNSEARQQMRASGKLDDQVTVGTERGERQFASGDRIMFLRNERSLEVKNGTLATVEQVTPERIAARLDDGRQVAFDTKDYTHVDHGYAATIHKSQGMTVDQAHVLVTPGMDRHSAYVSLSRHRDSVQLHYGRDEFADLGSLTRTLSRERAKDMASDYATDGDGARAFADRRDIRLPEAVRERETSPADRTAVRARSIFAGFKPREAAPALEARTPSHAPSQSKAIERFARATADIERMRTAGLPTLPHQQQALTRAGEALDQTQPHAARDLAAAFRREPALTGEAATGRTNVAMRAMALETEMRTNPELRADRFVAAWRRLGQQRDRLERDGDDAGADRLGKRMGNLAGALNRDPQLESVLRNRNAELGIEMKRGRSVDAVVANPPFSYRWDPSDSMSDDVRFKNYGLAPKSAADFAFLLHGFHFLKDDGVMAIILPHGVLFRGGAEERIRTKLLKDGHIDTVIGLPANLFYSTGIPVCILVLKKCKKPDDVLFINAAEHFERGKRQNRLDPKHIFKIVSTYQHRHEEPRYSRRVPMAEIADEKNGYNLNISRYVSTAQAETEIDLAAVQLSLVDIDKRVKDATGQHNEFLKELGLPLLP